MTTPYICVSCRRLGVKARKIRKPQWDSRASFISFNQPQPAHDGAATAQKGDEGTSLQRSSGRNKATNAPTPRHQQWPLARNSRDDILESLFLSPRDETSNGVRRGRYSASQSRDSDAPSENRSPNSRPLSLDTRAKDSNPTERTPSFRRLSRVRRPPITTLKRLPVHQRQPTDNNE